jgi:hypothetical protein
MTIAKAVVAVVIAACGALITGLGPNGTLSGIDTLHWMLIVGTILGSGGLTWLVSNIHGVAGGIAKSIVAFLSAGLASLVVALQHGPTITQSAWIVAFSAAVAAGAAVYEQKNAP